MKNTLMTRWTATTDTFVACGSSTGSRERYGVAPTASGHGTALPFGSAATARAGSAMTLTTVHTAPSSDQIVIQDVVRPNAYGIPRPRGPQR